MKTIGIIDAAWQSSAELYRMINELVNKKLEASIPANASCIQSISIQFSFSG